MITKASASSTNRSLKTRDKFSRSCGLESAAIVDQNVVRENIKKIGTGTKPPVDRDVGKYGKAQFPVFLPLGLQEVSYHIHRKKGGANWLQIKFMTLQPNTEEFGVLDTGWGAPANF
jgi:hypothetical protein